MGYLKEFNRPRWRITRGVTLHARDLFIQISYATRHGQHQKQKPSGS